MRESRVSARWRQAEGGLGKIAELRRETRDRTIVAAECLLAALGFEEQDEPDARTARAYVGALLVVEHMRKVEALIDALAKSSPAK